MILMWYHPIQSVNAQSEDDLTKEYDENLNLYILKNGDVIYHWDITDQGMFVDFPVNLNAPNSTTSAIEDASVVLNVYQSSPKPQDMGIYASENGGYFGSDLPDTQKSKPSSVNPVTDISYTPRKVFNISVVSQSKPTGHTHLNIP